MKPHWPFYIQRQPETPSVSFILQLPLKLAPGATPFGTIPPSRWLESTGFSKRVRTTFQFWRGLAAQYSEVHNLPFGDGLCPEIWWFWGWFYCWVYHLPLVGTFQNFWKHPWIMIIDDPWWRLCLRFHPSLFVSTWLRWKWESTRAQWWREWSERGAPRGTIQHSGGNLQS